VSGDSLQALSGHLESTYALNLMLPNQISIQFNQHVDKEKSGLLPWL
jgi:hypothetical protein